MKHRNILLSGMIVVLTALSASAINPSFYATTSALNSGHWVKIKVTGNGIHEITYDQLRAWGFSDPSKVNVHGFSVPTVSNHVVSAVQPDDLPQTPVYRGNDRLLFYAEGDISVDVTSNYGVSVSRNLSDLAGYYFLSESGEAAVPYEINLGGTGENPSVNHYSFTYYEPEEINFVNMGALFYSDLLTSAGRTFTFPVSDWTRNTDGRIYYNYVGRTVSLSNPVINLSDGVSIKDHVTGDLRDNRIISEYNIYASSSTGIMRVNLVDSATKELNVTILPPENPTCEFICIDNVAMVYQRDNNMTGLSQMRMNYPGNSMRRRVTVTGANENTEVWNITARHNIGRHAATFDSETGTLNFVLSEGSVNTLLLFDPAGQFPGVDFAGDVDNQNLHALETPDMVIITTAPLMAQAEKLADIHRQYQGFDVAVVDQAKIFNEFSSGARSVDGYRRFMKMLYDRGGNKLKYLLLMGESNYDNRGISIDASPNLLTYAAERVDHACNISVCYSADSFFGMLEDGMTVDNFTTRRINVGVGRIPSNDVSFLEGYIAKVKEYFENPPLNGSYNQALVFTGDGDANSHMVQGESMANLIGRIAPSVNVNKCYNALYKYVKGVPSTIKKAYAEAFARGQGFFSFIGHGSATVLAKSMSINDIAGLTFGASPMTVLATCETYQFDVLSSYIVKDFLKVPNGPAAVIASGRKVFQQPNQVFAEAIASNYYVGNPGDCIGDVYRIAHNSSSNEGEAQRKNNLCYGLAGDPALPVYRPVDATMVTAINGVDKIEGDTVTVYPLEPVKLTGVVTTPDGSVDTSFNGDIFISLYDAPKNVQSLVQSPTDLESTEVTVDETILGLYTAKVNEGRWEATVVAPEPMISGANNRMTLYARSTDNVTASGVERAALAVAASHRDGDVSDVTAPVIEEMYLNNRNFVDGSIVGAANTLVATILPDESGINFSSAIIGGSTRLILDGNHSYADAKGGMFYNADGSLTLTYNLNNLSEGLHSIELSVADNAGNRSSRRLAFHVLNEVDIQVVPNVETARENVEFDLRHSLDAQEFTGRLYVEDASGNTVYTRDNCSFPCEWNLTDNNGRRVADGTYRVYATVKTAGLYTSTPRAFVTVIK